jgi:hypothetical protein
LDEGAHPASLLRSGAQEQGAVGGNDGAGCQP